MCAVLVLKTPTVHITHKHVINYRIAQPALSGLLWPAAYTVLQPGCPCRRSVCF